MSVSVYVKGASFSDAKASIAAPNRDGLVGEWFFGVDEETTITNRAGGLPLIVRGSPTYGENYARCSGGVFGINNFITQILPQIDGGLTIVGVVKNNPSSNSRLGLGALCHARDGSIVGLYDQDANTIFYNGINADVTNAAVLTKPASGKWTAVVGKGGSGEYGELHIWQDDIKRSAVATSLGTRRANTSNSFSIVDDAVKDFDVAYIAIYERTVTAEEVDQIYAGVKEMMALRGIML